jgi:glycosyltransferase involved in cell wall biosynthesis
MAFLIIQIPCLNEEKSLPITLAALPKTLPGVNRIELQVIDDGCTDRTVEVAKAHGVHHIVSYGRNKGLAAAFMAGLHNALALGADIIVNTDADNQYNADDIEKLVAPIVEGRADYVIGSRPIDRIEHFSPIKKFLQKLGSFVVRQLSGTSVTDAPSGFRAISRAVAKRLFVYGRYTYTLETIIQAGQQKFQVISVPIRVNGELRPSRLISSIPNYIMRSLAGMGRAYMIYRPFRTFAILSTLVALAGLFLIGRFLWLFLTGEGDGYIQSLLLGCMALGISVVLFVAGLLADLMSVNRRLLEELRHDLSELSEQLRRLHG